ncbi:MAG: T9SS type A sorting domain-containing protein [Lewinellaceae bacterium]|nr:T9SS type A sorting domain-containing protein [Saprospiraceae bacterium]MCB9334202.1 T9SS type A sorting domain-containing protein [Lewinellaceae bacterium]
MQLEQRNKHRLLALAVFLALGFGQLQGQGWGITIFQQGGGGGGFAADGTYVTALTGFKDSIGFNLSNYASTTSRFYFHRIINGQAWEIVPAGPIDHDFHHFSRAAIALSKDSIVVLEEVLAESGGMRKVYLSLFQAVENTGIPSLSISQHWHTEIFSAPGDAFAKELVLTPGGGYAALLEKQENGSPDFRDVAVAQLDAQGTVVWLQDLGEPGFEAAIGLVPAPSGGYFVLKNAVSAADTSLRQIRLVRLLPDGAVLNTFNLTPAGSELGTALTGLTDGNLLLSGLDLAAGRELFLRKIAPDGSLIWQQNFPMTDRGAVLNGLVEDPSGDLVGTGVVTDSLAQETDGLLLKTTPDGQSLWERTIGQQQRPEAFSRIVLFPGGGYVLGGTNRPSTLNHAYMVRTDVNGIVKAGAIEGNVFQDLDVDCSLSAGDIPLENWIVHAYQDSLHSFFGDTDSLGNYRIECDTGDYVVTLILPTNYWGACANAVPVSVGYLDTVQLDFALQSLIDCPHLTVDHTISQARPCDTTVFHVAYCNQGTTVAEEAYLEMTLDGVFAFLDSDIPPSAINGNLITFPLGDLPPGHCAGFRFSALVSCDAQAGFVACSEAHIFPDSLCVQPDSLWSGALIQATGICHNDSVVFQLKNIGSQPMQGALDYIVIEDAVLLQQGTFELPAGGTMEIPVYANGSTMHFLAEQEPGAPGNSLPIAAVEACVGSSGATPSTGFFNQLPQNDADPFLSSLCWVITNSYDPNDKLAFPTGFSDEHFILENTELEYRIRFQNTGTDTAFRVILLDTLSAYLDPATVRPGASSHPYEFEIDGQGVLRFTFPGIRLPQEAVDAAGSQGYVDFRVAQKRGNVPGTVIENSAGIYFDFNLPVITNTTWHTVREPLILVLTDAGVASGGVGALQVFPNPAGTGPVTVALPDGWSGAHQFLLIDQFGQVVRSAVFTDGKYRLERDGLSAGIYFFQVKSRGQSKFTGSVIFFD